MIIKDATGSGDTLHVDSNNQAHVFGITEDELRDATTKGNAFNINTGLVAYTGSSASSVLYFKNDEAPVNGESSFIITALALYVGTRSATVTDDPVWTIIRNPDAGDIISDATAVDINANADFGSNNTLATTTLAYKGKDGGTQSGGTTHAIIAGTGRIFAPLNIEVPKGSSVGINVDLNTSGGANAYAALIGYRKDGKNS